MQRRSCPHASRNGLRDGGDHITARVWDSGRDVGVALVTPLLVSFIMSSVQRLSRSLVSPIWLARRLQYQLAAATASVPPRPLVIIDATWYVVLS